MDKISFTGGTATGRRMMELAARNLTPLALELGGKSPNIIFPDADLRAAAKMAAFTGSGPLVGSGMRSSDTSVRAQRRLRAGNGHGRRIWSPP